MKGKEDELSIKQIIYTETVKFKHVCVSICVKQSLGLSNIPSLPLFLRSKGEIKMLQINEKKSSGNAETYKQISSSRLKTSHKFNIFLFPIAILHLHFNNIPQYCRQYLRTFEIQNTSLLSLSKDEQHRNIKV